MDARGLSSDGRYTVVCGAFRMTSGKFAPVFKVFAGNDLSATPVYRQAYPSPGPNFHAEQEAVGAAAVMAREWIATAGPGVGD